MGGGFRLCLVLVLELAGCLAENCWREESRTRKRLFCLRTVLPLNTRENNYGWQSVGPQFWV